MKLAGEPSAALTVISLADTEDELGVVGHAVAPCRRKGAASGYRIGTEPDSSCGFGSPSHFAATCRVCPFCTRRRQYRQLGLAGWKRIADAMVGYVLPDMQHDRIVSDLNRANTEG